MKKNKLKNKLFFLLLMPFFIQAQNKISLQEAFELAIKNNLEVKNEKLKSVYHEKLIKSSNVLPNTQISTEIGQLNSVYIDNKFGIFQGFNFPSVYKKQKNLLFEQWKFSLLNVSKKEYELKKNIQQIFYYFLYLNEKENLLLETDKIYSEFLNKETLKLNKGESNILEKSMAENQKNSVIFQLQQLKEEKEITILQLQILLNSDQNIIPEGDFKQEIKSNIFDFSEEKLKNHPNLQILEQQKKIAEAQTQIEKSKLLPDFEIGIFSSSMKGNGANDIYYDSSTRFQAVQLNLGIPIFTRAQKTKINASKIEQEIVENDLLIVTKKLQNQLKIINSEYKNNQEIINLYETKSLPNALLITKTADKKFVNGEINYIEWSILINQTIIIKNEYLDILNKQNQIILKLKYLD